MSTINILDDKVREVERRVLAFFANVSYKGYTRLIRPYTSIFPVLLRY